MSQERKLAVVGAGNMGSGIAQKMATEGFRVVLVDLNDDALKRGMARIEATLGEAVERKILTPDAVSAILGRIEPTADWSRLADVELAVEAVFESLDVKKDVFKHLDESCSADCILATNTSSFYVRDLARTVSHPERVVGLHYFYHPAKNRLVEVVPTESTDAGALARAWAIQEAAGKTPITCKDAPGFVVNRYFVPWLNEAVRLLDEGVADIATIEAAAKKAFRIGMGPFELMNVTGVPIALHAATTLGAELGALYAPSPRLAAQVKSGENWTLTGTPDEGRFRDVEERLLGVIFQVAGELVDEGVGSIEDIDIGARVGLRWAKGPFELMNRLGVARAAAVARALAKRYDRALPKSLVAQEKKGTPFAFRLVELEKKNGVATLSLNRPDAMNAINSEVVAQLAARFSEAEADPDVKTIVIAGKGKGFIAGADIRFFVRHIEGNDISAIKEFTKRGQTLINRFAASPKIVIARLDGLSLGGGSELAMACDYIVATDKGSLGFPETGIGIYPGLGGTQRLPRRVGIPLARWLILSGTPVDATRAAAMGLVDVVVPHDQLDRAIRYLAARGKPDRSGKPPVKVPAGFEAVDAVFSEDLATLLETDFATIEDRGVGRSVKALGFKAPIALRLADELIRKSATASLAEGLAAELGHLDTIFKTKDAYEGLSTLGKSRPTFKGE